MKLINKIMLLCVMIYLTCNVSAVENDLVEYEVYYNGRVTTVYDAELKVGEPAIPVMVVNACKRRFVYLPFRKHFMVLHASTRYITKKIKDERRYNFRQLG